MRLDLQTLLAAAAFWAFGQAPALAQASPARPNIVLIIADDAALMDFGAYGGEARTPNIDALAARGALFTNYRSSPLCSPSRSMLLTGMDNHRSGHATIEEVLPPEWRGRPGYTLRLEPGVLTIADRLRAQGYRTLMSGKWHLGRGEGDLPNSHGFDRSLALDASGADNWAAKSYMPYYDHAPWYEDGKPAKLPKSFYSSDLLVDRLIGFLDEAAPGSKPYFAYLAFQAVHIPVQAPRAFSDNYSGRFDAGWEALRQARWERARQSGLVPDDAALEPLPGTARAWAELSEEDRRTYARAMEVYSGMLEAMDHAIGRLVARIADRGELENTIFVVTSDNGPEPSDPVHAPGINIWMGLNGYHWDRSRLGEAGSLNFIGPEWAAAISSPSQLYKFYASEGGLRVPLVMAGPGVPLGVRRHQFAFVTDVAPTLLDLAGAASGSPPSARPITGRSLAPTFSSEAPVRAPTEAVGLEVSGNAALYRGDYKIVRNQPPIGDGGWRLFNLAADPGETRDLSKAEPALYADMIAAYDAYAEANGVLPLPPGYQVQKQIMHNVGDRLAVHHRGHALGLGAILLAVIAGVVLMRRRARKA